MMGPHPTHKRRFSWDASSYDEICTLCGATDEVLGGWGLLAYPCPNAEPIVLDREALRLAGWLEDDPLG